ncbi:ELM1/GtrOC1 family putative glycosyltransferase [Azotobacter beijerinckii]|uniref:ELM1/GtrOC1 family putative glycosyltransferase n=1 Tax=Azotobacter beijerinckii TaxID=170623 RepID=UPI002952C6AC|nr:ELM1/GtrOC1 family putative glycosyltransferase [Azotobacter beijerinckii]MDV7212762.1 ELM1/GtrOC1 family putative glycosyltransferase [Azotobacter beijerinckii]
MDFFDKTPAPRILPFRRADTGVPAAGTGESTTAVPAIAPVVLEARVGAKEAPAVRIFLGTQPEQHRAERVFFYSLLRVRNPERRYEVYRMSGLPGFDRRGWRTGFTNYRFAIPDLAGRHGRAIYNDVDQIYLADPAELFDLPMDEHGYLALLPEDTAVMLIDCARMARCWNFAKACRTAKKTLCTEAAAEPGRWGALDPRWHARDQEYRHGESKLLHYTALHLQPWRPTPDRYSYHINPHAECFHSLEQAANREGYEIYTAENPSPGFSSAYRQLTGAVARRPEEICRQVRECGAASLALVGAWSEANAGGLSVAHWPIEALRRSDLPRQDTVAVTGLEQLPLEDRPWLVDRLFQLARQQVFVKVSVGPEGAPNGDLDSWRTLLRRVARRHPDRGWQLDGEDRQGLIQRYRADMARRIQDSDTLPTVWLLHSIHPGDNMQLIDLAKTLGWPYEFKRLQECLAKPATPWPDLVISVGWLSSWVARRIKRRSGGKTRLVVLGRPFAPLSHFDLVVTTPQYGLPLRRNVVDLPAPFLNERPLDAAALEACRQRFAHLPRPWIALLVGGSSKPYRLDAPTAAVLGREASAAARSRGGSLLVSTSPRTSDTATDALLAAIDVPVWSYRFGSAGDNPYPALLALADAFVVTGESINMLTEACMTGRPVAMFPLPARRLPLGGLLNASERFLSAIGRMASRRGTPLQQGLLGRLCDKAVEGGWFNRERLIGQVHRALGVSPLPEGLDRLPGLSPELLAGSRARAVQAIRDLMLDREVRAFRSRPDGVGPVEADLAKALQATARDRGMLGHTDAATRPRRRSAKH